MKITVNVHEIPMKIPLKSVKITIFNAMKFPLITNFSWPLRRLGPRASPQLGPSERPHHVLVVGHRHPQLGGVLLAGLLENQWTFTHWKGNNNNPYYQYHYRDISIINYHYDGELYIIDIVIIVI